jgi:iron(III) transport system permease protein
MAHSSTSNIAQPIPLRMNLGISKNVLAGLLLLLIIGAGTAVPVLYVLANSFNVADPGQAFRFSLQGWREVVSQPKTLTAIGYSFLLSVRIPIAIGIAILLAWLLIRVQIPGRRFIESVLWFAFFLPSLPLTMGWILLLDQNYGLVNVFLKRWLGLGESPFSIYSVGGILWVHLTLSTVPIMVILLAPALRRFDAVYEEAARMAGASVATTLLRVTFPLMAPAMIVAFIIGLIKSMEVFEIEQILGTPVGITVYATRVFDLIRLDPPMYAQAMALSALFLVILLVAALIYQSFSRRYEGRATVTGKGVHLQTRLHSRWSYAISGVIFLYLVVSIFMPFLVLILGSFTKLFGFFFLADPWSTMHWRDVFTNPVFLQATRNSLLVGLGVATLGTLLFSLLAWVLVRTNIWARDVISLFSWLPWAVPGLLLGMAVLAMLLNVPVVSWMYGSIVPVIGVLIIKDIPLGVQMLKTALYQISKELEEAAFMSGASFIITFRRIVLPLIAPMCISVFVLNFISTLRDISTTVLLATPGTRTLPLLMFEYATSGRFESAAVIGIIIALISLVVMWLAVRLGLKMEQDR